MIQDCLICKTKFEAPNSQKTCSETCRTVHRKNRRKVSDENVTVTRACKFCGEPFKAKRYKSKAFCDRSCASKYYIQDGTYDKWKACNPTLGRAVPDEQIERQKKTMIAKYGVACGYHLGKARRISKQQQMIYELVKSIDAAAVIEKIVPQSKYFADILLLNKKKIVEYNGDYWHCNPTKYTADYFNKKTGKHAKEIWDADLERRNILEHMGYSIFCVWESDFLNSREATEQKIRDFIK